MISVAKAKKPLHIFFRCFTSSTTRSFSRPQDWFFSWQFTRKKYIYSNLTVIFAGRYIQMKSYLMYLYILALCILGLLCTTLVSLLTCFLLLNVLEIKARDLYVLTSYAASIFCLVSICVVYCSFKHPPQSFSLCWRSQFEQKAFFLLQNANCNILALAFLF